MNPPKSKTVSVNHFSKYFLISPPWLSLSVQSILVEQEQLPKQHTNIQVPLHHSQFQWLGALTAVWYFCINLEHYLALTHLLASGH